MTREQISDFCVASLANVLRMPKEQIKTDAKFNRLGLDSAMVVYVMMELEEKLDLELSHRRFLRLSDRRRTVPLSRRKARRAPGRLNAPAGTLRPEMESFSSLVALLARAGGNPARRSRLRLPSDRGAEEAALTFRELHERRAALAARLDRRRPPRRSRAAGVSARPRIHGRLLRLPDRRRDRGADDDAAPEQRARRQRRHPRQLRAGGRADHAAFATRERSAGALCARRPAMARGRSRRLARRRATDLPAARPAGHRLPAIHLGLDLRSQGRRGQPRQSARQPGDDPPRRSATLQAIDLCQLGAALSRHGADPERAAGALCRRACAC